MYDSKGCPLHFGPGLNVNAIPNRVWDKSRILANFGIDAPATYSCRTDKIAPYKIDPPVRMGAEYARFLEPLRTHSYRLATITTDYVRFRSRAQLPAACAIEWILPWASAGIFTERAGTSAEGGAYLSRQGDYERVFYISSFVLAYAIVKDEPGLDPAKKTSIENWLRKVGNELHRFSEIRENRDKDRNNIFYRTGYSLMSIGIVLNNKTFIDRAISIYDTALTEITAQGLLPRAAGT